MPLRLLLPSFMLAASLACSNTSDERSAACEGVTCTAGTCVVQDGQPTCVCSAFEEAAGVVCALYLDEAGPGMDSAAPLLPSAQPVAGELRRQSSRSNVDVDVYSFAATAGEVYRVEATFETEDTYQVELLDPSGVRIAVEYCSLLEQRLSRVGFVAKQSGTHYLRISNAGSCSSDLRDSRYLLRLEALGPEDHGGSAEAASVLRPGAPAEGRVELPRDRDWFAFDTEPGHVYRFSCTPTELRHCHLTLRDAQGTSLVAARWEESSVALEAEGAARYFVELAAYEGDSYFVDWGRYHYQLEDLGPDDHGDTVERATPVAAWGSPVSVHVETRSDVDVLSVYTEPGRYYRVFNDSSDSFAPVELALLDGSGKVLSSWSNGLTFEGRGEVYLRASVLWSNPLGTFTLQLVDVGPDDHGDTPETASALGLGETAGRFQHGYDVDVFALTLDPDRYYRLLCTTCDITLSGPSMAAETLSLEGYSDAKALESHGGGVIYATMSMLRSASYVVRLEETGVDDFGDTAADAHPLPLGEALQGVLESRVDQDTFRVELSAGALYTLTTESDLRRWFVAPDGTPLYFEGDKVTPTQSGAHVLYVESGVTYWPNVSNGPYSFTLQ